VTGVSQITLNAGLLQHLSLHLSVYLSIYLTLEHLEYRPVYRENSQKGGESESEGIGGNDELPYEALW